MSLKTIKLGFVVGSLAALSLSCATSKKLNLEQVREGQWDARALVTEVKTGKSYILKLEISAVRDQSLRVDATAAMGYPVAALLWADRAIDLVLFENKKFYSGPPNPNLMEKVLRVPLDIEIWQDVIFDRPIAQKDWSCSRDANGFVAECTKLSGASKVTWSNRNGEKRSVKIDSMSGSVQVHFQSFRPKVEGREKIFSLKPPKGFSRFIL